MLKALTQHFLSSTVRPSNTLPSETTRNPSVTPSNTFPSPSLPEINWNFKAIDIETGERIRYSIIGNAPKVLVLIHGMFHNIKALAPVIPHLSKNFTIVCIEMRGHGGSSYNSPLLKMEDITTDIHCVLKALNIQKFSLYGVSLGGMICLRYAALYPHQVENLVMLGPLALDGNLDRQKDKKVAVNRKELKEVDFIKFLYRIKETRDLEQACKGLLPVCFNVRVPPQDILENLAKTNFEVASFEDILWIGQHYNFTNEKIGNVEPDYSASKIRCKVLILCGETDGYLPKERLFLYKDYLGKKVTIKIFPNTGHLIAELESEQVAQYVCDFCSGESDSYQIL